MNDQFVPYELALKLKGLGYNEISLFYYDTVNEGNPLSHCPHLLLNNQLEGFENEPISAPLWQQAFDWFRKNHQLEFILNNCSDKDHNLYDVVIYDTFKKKKHEDYVIRNRSKFYTTYEEARLECLKKLIEILEQ